MPFGLLLRWENEYSCGSGWLCTLTNGTPYSFDLLSSGCSTFDLYAHHLRLTVASGESVCSIAQRRYSMNSEDCGVTAAEEYMYIAALIAAVSLFRIHCHMALTVLEISQSLSNQVRISFNLANFAWSPPSIFLIRCCILSIDVLLSGPVLALEDGRRDGGLAIEKRERRGGGFGMEMMERRGGGFAMERRSEEGEARRCFWNGDDG